MRRKIVDRSSMWIMKSARSFIMVLKRRTTASNRNLKGAIEGTRTLQKTANKRSVSSVTHLCPTLCNPMDCSTPGFPVHHQLPEFTQTHVHQVGDGHPTISSSVIPFSSHLQSRPPSGCFPVSQFFTSGGQSLGVSASASVLPMNTQDRSLGWTGWICLQSNGLSRVFSNTIVQKHQFFSAQLFSQFNCHITSVEKPQP